MTLDAISREQVGAIIVIRLQGDIDAVNAHGLTTRALAMCDFQHPMVLDVGEVTYLDSAGVRLVDALSRHCSQIGTTFVVVVPEDAVVRRLLELTLPTVRLIGRIEDSVSEANDA
jgi:anti-anti-sigma factor